MQVITTGRIVSQHEGQQQQQQQEQRWWSMTHHRHRPHWHSYQSRKIKGSVMSPRARRTSSRTICASRASCANAIRKEQIRRLCDWLQQGGAEMQGLAILPVEGRGIGVYTERRFGKGERLATVPEALFLRPPIAMRHGESQWAGLVSALLDEMYLGTRSRWFPYISMLPSQSLHPLMWSEEQIEVRLDGSPMRNLLESRLEECSVISSDLGKRNDHVRWAYATICSRSFALGGEGNESIARKIAPDTEIALVPLADAFNHSTSNFSGEFRFTQGTGDDKSHVFLDGRDSFEAHEEILNLKRERLVLEADEQYGSEISPYESFLDYGFTEPSSENPTSGVEILGEQIISSLMRLKDDEPLQQLNLQLLSAIGMLPHEISFPIKCTSMPEFTALDKMKILGCSPYHQDDCSHMAFARACIASEEQLSALGWDGNEWTAQSAEKCFAALHTPLSTEAEALVAASMVDVASNILLWADSGLDCLRSDIESGQGRGSGRHLAEEEREQALMLKSLLRARSNEVLTLEKIIKACDDFQD